MKPPTKENDRRKAFSCIIPFYNEGKRIISVIEAVGRVDCISQVIAIDDGSTDGMAACIEKQFSSVILIRFPENEGKAEAVHKGLAQAREENLLLLDADLFDLDPGELHDALEKFVSDLSLDMIILKFKSDHEVFDYEWINNVLRNNIFLSGLRIMRKVDLEAVFEHYNPSGYQLEVSVNDYMMHKKKKVFWIDISAKNLHKSIKGKQVVGLKGFIVGFIDDNKMQRDIISFIGFSPYYKQMLFFCRKELR